MRGPIEPEAVSLAFPDTFLQEARAAEKRPIPELMEVYHDWKLLHRCKVTDRLSIKKTLDRFHEKREHRFTAAKPLTESWIRRWFNENDTKTAGRGGVLHSKKTEVAKKLEAMGWLLTELDEDTLGTRSVVTKKPIELGYRARAAPQVAIKCKVGSVISDRTLRRVLKPSRDTEYQRRGAVRHTKRCVAGKTTKKQRTNPGKKPPRKGSKLWLQQKEKENKEFAQWRKKQKWK